MADRYLGVVLDQRYRLCRAIASGAFGSVYEADELLDGQPIARVAVKLIAADHDLRRYLYREVQALAELDHPHILAYRSSGTWQDGQRVDFYVVTELAECTLADLMRNGALPPDDVAAPITALAEALAWVHAHGQVHRDVKPANLFRVQGVWKLGDFGLVRGVRDDLTQASVMAGTVRFMSPEMLIDGLTGPPGDVWALGVTTMLALTGRYPHQGTTDGQLVHNISHLPPAIPHHLPPVWHVLITQCLAGDPQARPAAGAVADWVRGRTDTLVAPPTTVPAVAEAPRSTGRPKLAAAMAVALLGLLGLAVVAVALVGLPRRPALWRLPPRGAQSGQAEVPPGSPAVGAVAAVVTLRGQRSTLLLTAQPMEGYQVRASRYPTRYETSGGISVGTMEPLGPGPDWEIPCSGVVAISRYEVSVESRAAGSPPTVVKSGQVGEQGTVLPLPIGNYTIKVQYRPVAALKLARRGAR